MSGKKKEDNRLSTLTPEELEAQGKREQLSVNTDGSDVRQEGQTTSVHQSSGSNMSVGNQSGTSTSEQSGSSRSESQMQLTPEAQQAEREARDAYMQSHGYVKAPDGTWKLNQTLFDALNIPREELRKERERQQKENRMKQLVTGLYHSGALLSDMISAGVGGNVWKREKDDTAEKAAAENKQLRTLQLAEDAAFAEKQRKDMQDTLDKAQQQADQRRRELMKTVSTQTHSSKGEQKSESRSSQRNNQQSASVGNQTSVDGTTYSDALKGGGVAGRSRRGVSGGNTAYVPIRLQNTDKGEQYVSFAMSKEEKEALAGAIARSIIDAAQRGDVTAKELWGLYFTPGKRTGKERTPDKWNYDGLMNDASLYRIPGVLNRYLDELERMGMTYTDPNTQQEMPYSRTELYEMMTGDMLQENVPSGVVLGPGTTAASAPWLIKSL